MLVEHLVPLLCLLSFALTSPIEPRYTQMCGQYQQDHAGSYTLSTNGWGYQYGSGEQCSSIQSFSGNTISWETDWDWANTTEGQYHVKSYANVQRTMTSRPLSQFNSIPTSWNWYYVGNDYIANVAYDTFLGHAATGAQTHEIMVWIGYFGADYPLSDSGYPPTPIASPTIGTTPFNLILGHNGQTTVYSFVAQNYLTTDYSGDLNDFYKYLIAEQGLDSSLYLQYVQAGTEVFYGTGMKLTTNSYSLSDS